MESLLRWGITNSAAPSSSSDPSAPPPAPRQDLDPAIIDAILGKPDAELMKEALTRARDESLDEDARVEALDDLEMLVEHIDNATDLERLQMWPPIHDLISSPTSSDAIKTQAVWVAGTAVQNNPKAQHAYLSLSPLPTLLALLTPTTSRSPALRSKTVYALSGLLKHNARAVKSLSSTAPNGWTVLRDGLHDSDISVRRKIAFLLNGLLLPSAEVPVEAPGNVHGAAAGSTHPGEGAQTVHDNTHASMLADPASTDTAATTLEALGEHGIVGALVNALTSPVPHGDDGEEEGDVDLEEKIVRVLHTFVAAQKGDVGEGDREKLRAFFGRRAGEVFGLDESEFGELSEAVKA
ncbi:unnamed protein product [Peniophora sp. CBMAI 1063]|nr:unnamed protein product [Peniophora sp. CBMAI 1063]